MRVDPLQRCVITSHIITAIWEKDKQDSDALGQEQDLHPLPVALGDLQPALHLGKRQLV